MGAQLYTQAKRPGAIVHLAKPGPLRARDLARRLAPLDPRIDRHLINSVLHREGKGRAVYDPARGLYRLKSGR